MHYAGAVVAFLYVLGKYKCFLSELGKASACRSTEKLKKVDCSIVTDTIPLSILYVQYIYTPYLIETVLAFLLPKAWADGLDQAQCRESGLLHGPG